MSTDPTKPTTNADCHSCNRPTLKRCEWGEMHYTDGSSRICPNWNNRLEEISVNWGQVNV